MDTLFCDKSIDAVLSGAGRKVRALIADCEKSSTVFCLGIDKDLILANLRAFIDIVQKAYRIEGYTINTNCEHITRKFYIQRLSERVGSLVEHVEQPLHNGSPLMDIMRVVLSHNPGHAPELVLNHYRADSKNFTEGGKYQQPDETMIVPITIGDQPRRERRAAASKMYNLYGIAIGNMIAPRKLMADRWSELSLACKNAQKVDTPAAPAKAASRKRVRTLTSAEATLPAAVEEPATIEPKTVVVPEVQAWRAPPVIDDDSDDRIPDYVDHSQTSADRIASHPNNYHGRRFAEPERAGGQRSFTSNRNSRY